MLAMRIGQRFGQNGGGGAAFFTDHGHHVPFVLFFNDTRRSATWTPLLAGKTDGRFGGLAVGVKGAVGRGPFGFHFQIGLSPFQIVDQDDEAAGRAKHFDGAMRQAQLLQQLGNEF
jgi:hypothetical protein